MYTYFFLPVVNYSVNTAVDLWWYCCPVPGPVDQRQPIKDAIPKLVADRTPQTILMPLRVIWVRRVGSHHDYVLDISPSQVNTVRGGGGGGGLRKGERRRG